MIPLRKNFATVAAVVAALAAAVAAAPLATAHQGTNHGTIKVHDDAVVVPPERNDPHVSCDFWIEGFNMADDSGTLVFYSWPPTGDKSVVMEDNWTGVPEEDGDGFHFLAGPYQLDPGHYRVEAYIDAGHPGNRDHFAKAKMFWVNECPDGVVEEPDCPSPVTAIPEQDGDIRLDWPDVEDADTYRVYLMNEDGEWEWIANTESSTFTFTNTTVGETYTFAVTVVVDGQESDIDRECTATATAIPFFPSVAVAAAAVLGSVVAFATFRRRRG